MHVEHKSVVYLTAYPDINYSFVLSFTSDEYNNNPMSIFLLKTDC